jgi:AcrR family transcriptional regulator
VAGKILPIAGLLPHQHQVGAVRALPEDGLGRSRVELAGRATCGDVADRVEPRLGIDAARGVELGRRDRRSIPLRSIPLRRIPLRSIHRGDRTPGARTPGLGGAERGLAAVRQRRHGDSTNAYAQSMQETAPRRRYTLRRRAERQAETRARIVEAALAEYAAGGPSRATISGIAARAGVERLTVYRHFPDGTGLVEAACGRLLADHPLPDMRAWFAERRPAERLRSSLGELFAFYRAAGAALEGLWVDRGLVDEVPRGLDPLTTPLRQLPAALAEGWPTYGDHGRERLRAVIAHALAPETWRSLTRDAGLPDDAAVEVLVRLATVTARPDA